MRSGLVAFWMALSGKQRTNKSTIRPLLVLLSKVDKLINEDKRLTKRYSTDLNGGWHL